LSPPWFFGVDVGADVAFAQYTQSLLRVMKRLHANQTPPVICEIMRRKCMLGSAVAARAAAALTPSTVYCMAYE
jgi:hypothetical protein